MIVEIPVSSEGAQTFVTQLGEVKYRFDVKYNDRSKVWTLDLSEDVSGLVLFQGVPLVLGQDIFEPYNFEIGRMMVVDMSSRGIDAGPDDLGDRVLLIWFSPDEVI